MRRATDVCKARTCHAKMSYRRLPFTAGFFPVLPEARGANVAATFLAARAKRALVAAKCREVVSVDQTLNIRPESAAARDGSRGPILPAQMNEDVLQISRQCGGTKWSLSTDSPVLEMLSLVGLL